MTQKFIQHWTFKYHFTKINKEDIQGQERFQPTDYPKKRNLLANRAHVRPFVLKPHLDARFVRLSHLPSTRTSQLDKWLLQALLTNSGDAQNLIRNLDGRSQVDHQLSVPNPILRNLGSNPLTNIVYLQCSAALSVLHELIVRVGPAAKTFLLTSSRPTPLPGCAVRMSTTVWL